MTRKKTDVKGGVRVNALGALQNSDGTALTDKNFGFKLIFNNFSLQRTAIVDEGC